MVDVSDKKSTVRVAIAKGSLKISNQLCEILTQGTLAKGDAFTVAKTAGIIGAKKTGELIPMCHPLGIDQIEILTELNEKEARIYVTATVRCEGKTGVEMEALTAVSITTLTLYDMCKAVDKEMMIEQIGLARKTGGKSGDFTNPAFS